MPEECKNLDEYLDCFALPLQIMQNKGALERISFELFEDAAKENVKYLEVRFGPLLHQQKGLELTEIIDSVAKGMKRAEALYDIHGNYILSVLRGMPIDDIKSVIDAERIGHGVHMKDHEQAYSIVKDKAIALELCPTSNVQTKCVAKFADHPVSEFHKDDVVVTINTDNRTVSNTTMTKEVEKVWETFKLTKEDYRSIYLSSVSKSFASKEIKQHLLGFESQIMV